MMSEAFLHSILGHWDITRLPLPASLRISGITGHRMQVVDYVEAKIELLDRTITRPIIIVRGLQDHEVILGWDSIKDEGLILDGKKKSCYFSVKNSKEEWSVAAIVAARRTAILPRTVHKLSAVAMLNDSCVAKDQVGLCENLPQSVLGLWDCVTQVEANGEITLAVTNTTDQKIELNAGDQVGIMRNPDKWDDIIRPLNDETIASIMGEIGMDPKEPERGQTKPLSPQDKADLIARLNVKAQGVWKQRFLDLILRYHDVCSKDKYDLGRAGVIKHSIRVKDNIPTHARQFRIPIEHEQVVHGYIDELLKQGAIEISRSPYNSPIFCVTKKVPAEWPVGQPPPLRCVLDYRQINMKSLPDRYAIKEIREYIDEVGKNKSGIFSAVDLTSGFWQQELEEASRQYTAFTVPGRSARYQWRVTPMGLQGSPASFARLMDHVMRGLTNVLTYIDDVLVHTQDNDKHIEVLENTLLRLRKFGMKLNVSKSIFAASQVQYLGFTISADGVSPSDDKLKAIRGAQPPQNIKQIREFVGVANYFRFLVKDFSRLATCLTALIKQDSDWAGGTLPPAAANAFESIKKQLCDRPVVAYPVRDQPFLLQTDGATGDKDNPGGLGAVLLQAQPDGTERVIAYASRALKTHEKNYSAFLLEMAAAVYGIEFFDVYLRGKKFTLYCDHKPLEKLNLIHTKTLNRLQQLMTEYTFEMRYKPGKENAIADYLSRNVVASLEDDSGNLLSEQTKDTQICDIAQFLKIGRLPKGDKAYIQRVRRIAKECILIEKLVWYEHTRKGFRSKRLLYAPQSLRDKIVQAAHVQLDAGHGGSDRTINRVLMQYWWPGLTSQVIKLVRNCEVCQRTKSVHEKAQPLQSLPLCTQPNQRCHIDLFGPLRISGGGKKYIMVMTDAFTKLVQLEAIENKEAVTVARAFFERWICHYSAPQYVVTDQGKEFCNMVLDLVCELWGIDKKRTSPFHPQSNSSAESYNRSIVKYMRAVLTNDTTTDWELYLAPMMLSYNVHVHKATLESPFFLTFLHDPKLPHFDIQNPRKLYMDNYAAEAFNLAQAAHIRVAHNLGEQKRRQEKYFDKSTKERSYDSGDKVIVHFPNVPVGVNQKFYTKWRLFTVDRMVGPVNVSLKASNRSKRILVHINRTRLATPAEQQSIAIHDDAGIEAKTISDANEGGAFLANSGSHISTKVVPSQSGNRPTAQANNIDDNVPSLPPKSRYNLRSSKKLPLPETVKFLSHKPAENKNNDNVEENEEEEWHFLQLERHREAIIQNRFVYQTNRKFGGPPKETIKQVIDPINGTPEPQPILGGEDQLHEEWYMAEQDQSSSSAASEDNFIFVTPDLSPSSAISGTSTTSPCPAATPPHQTTLSPSPSGTTTSSHRRQSPTPSSPSTTLPSTSSSSTTTPTSVNMEASPRHVPLEDQEGTSAGQRSSPRTAWPRRRTDPGEDLDKAQHIHRETSTRWDPWSVVAATLMPLPQRLTRVKARDLKVKVPDLPLPETCQTHKGRKRNSARVDNTLCPQSRAESRHSADSDMGWEHPDLTQAQRELLEEAQRPTEPFRVPVPVPKPDLDDSWTAEKLGAALEIFNKHKD